MAGVNDQSNQENYAYSIPFNHMRSMDPNHDQMRSMPLDYVNYANCPLLDPTINNATYFYPLGQASFQPPSQEPFSSVTGLFDHNGIFIGVNEPLLNTTHYGYTENNENRVSGSIIAMNDNLINDNPPSVYYTLSHSSVQAPPTRSNNASMTTNAASHGQVIIIMNADINVERLLSIIQSCGRVERIYM